jgi:hypothetical protein
MKFTVLDAKSRDYRERRFEVEPCWNIPAIWEWWKEEHRLPSEQLILDDNREAFAEILGKPSFRFRGECLFHCWLVDLGDARVLVLTAAGKGTCYEAVRKWRGKKLRMDKDLIIRFLKHLRAELKKRRDAVPPGEG